MKLEPISVLSGIRFTNGSLKKPCPPTEWVVLGSSRKIGVNAWVNAGGAADRNKKGSDE